MGGTHAEEAIVAGRFVLSLDSFVTDVHSQHGDHDDVVGRGPMAIVHDQHLLLSDTRLQATYGLSDHVALKAYVPFRVVGTTIRYLDAADPAVEVQLVQPGIHHRDETLAGLADPRLTLRLGTRAGDWWLEARAGTTVPLGRTEANPFVLGDMGLPHEHIQFGTGTFDPVAGVGAMRGLGPVTLDLWAFTEQVLYANGHGYRSGDHYVAGAGLGSALGTRAWRFELDAQAVDETAESWAGTVVTDEGNLGRLDVLLGARVTRDLGAGVAARATVQVPVYSHMTGAQVSYPILVGVGLTATVGSTAAPAPEPPRDPDLDIADATTTGAAVPLDAVAGKITVYDFWAPWCVPCRDLDRRLAEIAGRRPDLAIRKIDIVDGESPAARTYLEPGGFGLPHIVVVGADGARLLERSGDPEALADAMLALLPARP